MTPAICYEQRRDRDTVSTETNSLSDGIGHALVIGGSMAGLFAARVLSEHFERVTILERDRFPDGPKFRKGVPNPGTYTGS